MDTAIPRDPRLRDTESFRDFMTSIRAYARATDDVPEAKKLVRELFSEDGCLAYMLPLEQRALLVYAFDPDN